MTLESELPHREQQSSDAVNLEKIEQDVSLHIEKFKELPVIAKAFDILDTLSNDLKYHNKAHTEDVFHEAILFGLMDHLGEKELERLAIATAWHDVGYIIKNKDNEEEAIQLLEKEIPEKIIDSIPVEEIQSMILDTKLRISDHGPAVVMTRDISAHLLDADVSNFGRTDFKEKGLLIAAESGMDLADKETKRKFLTFVYQLMKNHDWHTDSARTLRQAQKMINLTQLEKEIAELQ